MNNICFIPARNSSTRLKNKNISLYGNDNLIVHTIKQAKKSLIFDRIILSSNDKNILNMGKSYNIDLHYRDDKSDQIINVLQNTIYELNIPPEDSIGLLLVTCPLRNIEDIINAHNIFLENDKRCSVVSVKKNENPIQMSFKISKGNYLLPVMPDDFYRSTRKQDHYDTFFYNDGIIFDTVKRFMIKGRTLYGESSIPYIMPWERSIAIDYKFQLDIVRCLRKTHE